MNLLLWLLTSLGSTSSLSQIFAFGNGIRSTHETFTENLEVRPTPDGKLVTTFRFTMTSPGLGDYYTLFPMPLGQILRWTKINEMHLSLNSGNWDYERWGYESDVGSGGELWTWIEGDEASVNSRWSELQNSLGGLFCASLSSTTDSHPPSTSSPSLTFPPSGPLPLTDLSNSSTSSTSSHHPAVEPYHLRRKTWPSERLCTENLTPFLKLLPCKNKAGLAELLQPHSLVGADWHGMGIHTIWLSETEGGEYESRLGGVKLELLIRVVFDPVRMSGGTRDWSFRSLFGRDIERRCSASTNSAVSVHLPSANGDWYSITPDPQKIIHAQGGRGSLGVFGLEGEMKEPLNIELKYGEAEFQPPLHTPSETPIKVRRHLLSSLHSPIQNLARLRIEFENHENLTEGMTTEVVYTEVVPWFFMLYLHTLKFEEGVSSEAKYKILSYSPSPHTTTSSTSAVEERAPTHLSLLLSLPTGKTALVMDVELAFLRYTAFVPDAQRGVDLPGAVVRVLSSPSSSPPSDEASSSSMRIYTPPMLVTLPTPDFSMPYNVIVMTSTVMGYMFTNTFNILTRKIVLVRTGN